MSRGVAAPTPPSFTLALQGWWTPLHIAAENGHLEVVRLLLSHSADKEATDKVRAVLPPRQAGPVAPHVWEGGRPRCCFQNTFSEPQVLSFSYPSHDLVRQLSGPQSELQQRMRFSTNEAVYQRPDGAVPFQAGCSVALAFSHTTGGAFVCHQHDQSDEC